MTRKSCELCSNVATMFCKSDQASLCWECDEKVHAANFLVAKHSRTLLCHLCRSPTPWKAAGPKLGRTVSVCHACTVDRENRGASSSRRDANEDGRNYRESESDGGDYYSDSDDYSEEEKCEDELEEDGDNQVVPWSTATLDPPPPTTAASSDEAVSFSTSKRTRDNSEDGDGCCSSDQDVEPKLGASELTSQESRGSYGSDVILLRPSKVRRRSTESGVNPQCSSGTAAIVEKLRRFQQELVREEGDASAAVLSNCKLTRR